MKIGYFYAPYYPVTVGSSVHGYELSRALVKRGHTLITFLDDKNPEVIKYPNTKIGALRVARDADVLYIRTLRCLDHCSLLKLIRPFSLPVIWEINAPIEEYLALHPDDNSAQDHINRANRRLKLLSRFADASVCVTETLKDYSRTFLKIKDSHYVANGSNPKHFLSNAQAEKLLNEFGNFFRVFWIGNPSLPWHALDLIFKVAKKINLIDKEIIFILLTPSVRFNTPLLDLNAITVLEGINYPQLPQYLSCADTFLCLYHDFDWCKYGFYLAPLKLFDYMAAGKPVIASNMGEIKNVVKNDVNGYLTDNRVDEIVEKIIMLKNNPEKRRLLGEKARQDIINHYNWDRAAREIEQIMLSVIQKRA